MSTSIQFQFPLRRPAVENSLQKSILIFFVALLAAFLSLQKFLFAPLEMLFILTLLPVLMGAAFNVFYLVGLLNDAEAALSLSEVGLLDQCSPTRLGLIQRSDIVAAQLITVFFWGSCLRVKIHPQSAVWRAKSHAYRRLFGSTIYLPLDLFEIAKSDVAGFMQFLRWVEPAPPGQTAAELPAEQTQTIALDNSTLLNTADAGAFLPEQKFAHSVVEHYRDQLLFLPRWRDSPTLQLPSSLSQVQQVQRDGEDILTFYWQQYQFRFVMDFRGEDDLSTLALWVQQVEVMRVEVQLQVATFDYIRTQHFRIGPWMGSLEQLFSSLRQSPELQKTAQNP